jgi:predicted RNA-binding Zn-ribbon protein involved in translation (DUF1610 family)
MGASEKRREVEEQIRDNAKELLAALKAGQMGDSNKDSGMTFKIAPDPRPPRLYDSHICPVCQTKRMLPVQRFLGTEEDYSVMFTHFNPAKQLSVKKPYDFYECPKCGLCLWFRSDAKRISDKEYQ